MSGLRDRIPGPLRALLRRMINHVPIYSRAKTRKDQEQLRALENQLRQAQIMIDELSATVRDLGGLVPPPMKLQTRIISRRLERFFVDGAATVREFERILSDTGRSLKSFDAILDFGSGCARIARPLRDFVGPAVNLYATDIDREAIDWCRQNYAAVADFEVNDPWPPLKYEDSRFDLIYGLSVFTHLPEEMQVKWLKELNRILKPEGYLILTTHGEAYYEHLSVAQLAELETNGFLYYNNGLTPGLPDFYQTTFHTHDYVRRRWAEHLQVISIESRAILGRQDAILCTKKKD